MFDVVYGSSSLLLDERTLFLLHVSQTKWLLQGHAHAVSDFPDVLPSQISDRQTEVYSTISRIRLFAETLRLQLLLTFITLMHLQEEASADIKALLN